MNLPPEFVIIVRMLTAALIDDERLLPLTVVAPGHKITVCAVRIRIADKTQQLARRNSGIRQRGAIGIRGLLVAGVVVGCRQSRDLSVCRVDRPCCAILVGVRSARDVVFDLGGLATSVVVFQSCLGTLRIERCEDFAIVVVARRVDQNRVGSRRHGGRTCERRSAVGAVVC